MRPGPIARAGLLALSLSACMLENPGVDRELATRSERGYHAVFLNNGLEIGLRLSRTEGVTRMFLDNPGQAIIDTLTLFAQVSAGDPPPGSPDGIAWPLFNPAFLSERILGVRGLQPGKEIDLGTLTPAFSGRVDELHINLIPLGYAGAGKTGGGKRTGCYRGRFERIGAYAGSEPDSADIRGNFDQWGQFYMWTDSKGAVAGMRGRLTGDTIQEAYYTSFWYARQQVGGRFALRDSAGAMIMAMGRATDGGRDSIKAVLERIQPEPLPVP